MTGAQTEPGPPVEAGGSSPKAFTFLFTDIEGSTRLWESHPEIMRTTLARHDEIMRRAIESCSGQVFKTIGDAFCATFASGADALRATAAAQTALHSEPWPPETPIRVRMAVHTGPAVERDQDYFGPTLNRVARLLGVAHGGQTVLSETVHASLPEGSDLGFQILDLGVVRLKDLASPERVFQVVCPGLPSEFPPLRSVEGSPARHNLPAQLTTFVGRRKELEQVSGLLVANRLVTLTGSGGSGKTRLAVQAASEQADQFKDGVWFVDLAAVSDPGLVPAEVAAVQGIREEPGQSITQALVASLGRKAQLLVLDNCEHLLAGCAHLIEALLRSCPDVKVMATSREPLNIPGEATFRVPSLSLPDPKRSYTPDELEEFESVRLFVDRARLTAPSFAIAPDDCKALARVCWQLDGIPLAIELAAARVRSMSIEQISTRLNDRFRLLTGGSRTAMPRQQTLKALVDWSYGLLTDAERAVLRRLSVFAGGWTLEAAERVVVGAEVEDWEVLDLLTSLVDKSLVNFDSEWGRERYRLLETVKGYASEKLEECGERAETVAKHLEWFASLAEQSGAWTRGPQRQEWLERLEPEQDNLWLALEAAKDGPDATPTARLAWSLGLLFEHRGFLKEAQRAVDVGLTALLARPWGEPLLLARLQYERAGLHQDMGEPEQAAALAKDALAQFEAHGDRAGTAMTENLLGQVTMGLREFGEAESRFMRALGLFQETGDRLGSAIVLNNLGVLARRDPGSTPEERAEHLERARDRLVEALAIRRELGDTLGEAETVNNLGVVAFEREDYLEAWDRYRDALRIEQSLDRRTGIGTTLANLGEVADVLGDSHLAARSLGLAVRVLDEVQSPLVGSVRSMLGDVVVKLTEAEAEEASRRVANARLDTLIEAILSLDFAERPA